MHHLTCANILAWAASYTGPPFHTKAPDLQASLFDTED